MPADVLMTPADVTYVTNWQKTTGIRLNMLFNAVGACSADTAADQSSAICNGSTTDGSTTYTDPGQSVAAGNTNAGALVNALLANQSSFYWETHTWSHQFLGCTVWQPQALTSATANGTGGTFAAGAYNYEITAATAYGESEPSTAHPVTVGANGSVALSWPEATNGTGTAGNAGPTLAQEAGQPHRRDRLLGLQRLPGEPRLDHLRPGRPGAREHGGDVLDHLQLHRYRDHAGGGARLGAAVPHRHQPRHRLLQRRRQLAARHQHHR